MTQILGPTVRREGRDLVCKPNRPLTERVEPLDPGTTLDLGCGEGADAVWLAKQGWCVTAVDVSKVALGRTRELAEKRGSEISSKPWDAISTRTFRAATGTWFPPSICIRGSSSTGRRRYGRQRQSSPPAATSSPNTQHHHLRVVIYTGSGPPARPLRTSVSTGRNGS